MMRSKCGVFTVAPDGSYERCTYRARWSVPMRTSDGFAIVVPACDDHLLDQRWRCAEALRPGGPPPRTDED